LHGFPNKPGGIPDLVVKQPFRISWPSLQEARASEQSRNRLGRFDFWITSRSLSSGAAFAQPVGPQQ